MTTMELTPEMESAAEDGDAGAMRRIIEGVSPNAVNEQKETALHVAAFCGHCDVAQILIEAGADVNALSDDCVTPLDMAVKNNEIQMAKLLLRHGARMTDNEELLEMDDDEVDDLLLNGAQNPVHMAIRDLDLARLQGLLEAAGNVAKLVAEPDFRGLTLLHVAAQVLLKVAA